MHAFRQEVLKYLYHYRHKLEKGEDGTTALDNDLAKLMLVRVRQRVPPTYYKSSFGVPKFTKDVIWINGYKAPFADVIAPYKLIQCKHSIGKKPVKVDLSDELRKCGLLRNNNPNDGVGCR